MCPSPTQPGTGHLGTGNHRKLEHKNEEGHKDIRGEQEQGSPGSKRSRLGISSMPYGVDAPLMEMAGGKLKATAPSKQPKRTKVNPAREKTVEVTSPSHFQKKQVPVVSQTTCLVAY